MNERHALHKLQCICTIALQTYVASHPMNYSGMDVGRPTETTTCHRKILSRKYLINWRRRLERNERTTTAAGWSRDKYIVFETPQISYAFKFLCIVRKLQLQTSETIMPI